MAVLDKVIPLLRRRTWPDRLIVGPRLRRARFIAQLRFRAWRARATVDIEVAPDVLVGRYIGVELRTRSRNTIRVGAGSKIGDGVLFRLRGGSILLGEGVDVRAHVVLAVNGGTISCEGPNILSWGTVVHCAESVRLARFAYVGEYVTIVDSSHFHTAPDEWSYLNSRSSPVEIGYDVWICPKCTVTGGVTVDAHAVLASNSVVIRDVGEGVLASGVPAKAVRDLDLPWRRQPAADA
jgi:acetyltransferase-like isoleucine patch superfamily enzyme